ncbi:MAG: hypothetical protein COW42_16245 [Deltaproteobacteria bacterium CG17_big_fil_post_rev_8_21_14_2_50_63_7]|nr:MAG: hypothetical protein COW42_16245 [Deltaproteobacteria bacterium CG17_big_fil_post_rev_8_21_14_2_50_63_7]
MRRSSYCLLVMTLILAVATFACSNERKSSKGGGSESSTEKGESGTAKGGEDKVDEKPNDEGADPDDDKGASDPVGDIDSTSNNGGGTISSIGVREGSTVSSDKLADGGGMTKHFKQGSGNGFFLLAGSSMPNSSGGDVLRRVDLDGTPTEHDYNSQVEGNQGMHILVSASGRGDWKTKDFGSDGLFQSSVCGLIPGPGNKVIALAARGAFVIDPTVDDQSVTPDAVIVFPGGFNVCTGVYSEKWNRLYATDVVRVEGQGGQKGIYVAEIPEGTGKAVNSDLFKVDANYGFNQHSKNLFSAVELYNDVLYLVESGARFDANYDTGVHRVPLNDAGEPLFAKATQFRGENPIERAQGCTLNPDNTAGALVVVAGTTPILFTGGTQGVVGWDLSSDTMTKLDLNKKRPGSQPLDLDPFGQGSPEIKVSPAGDKAFILPHCRSRSTRVDMGGYGKIFALRAAQIDVGETISVSGNGVDIGYTDTLKQLINDLEPAYLPKFSMSLRDMAVGPKHIAVIGAGKSGASGLDAGTNVIIIDLDKGGPIAFGEHTNQKKAHGENYGLQLAAGDPDFSGMEQTIHAAIWVP